MLVQSYENGEDRHIRENGSQTRAEDVDAGRSFQSIAYSSGLVFIEHSSLHFSEKLIKSILIDE